MDAEERKRLEDAGFRVGSAADFLDLSEERHEFVKIKVALCLALKQQRGQSGLSQCQLAEKIGSSQSRIAKIEADDPHVSLELMLRALLALGMTRRELADIISQPSSHSCVASCCEAEILIK